MEPNYHDKDWLYQKYWVEKLSTRQIGQLCHVRHKKILMWLNKFNIVRRPTGASLGHFVSKKTREKMKVSNKGKHCKPLSEESKIKISMAHKGMHHTIESRAKMSAIKKGILHPNWGKHLSIETCAKISAANKGKYRTEETRAKMSAALIGKRSGEKHPLWRGGLNICKYGKGFTRSLCERIRQRDGHICQFIGCDISENGRKHPVHHIDYDKTNNNPINLITLCYKHHSKTSIGNREYWMSYYQNIQMMRDISNIQKITPLALPIRG